MSTVFTFKQNFQLHKTLANSSENNATVSLQSYNIDGTEVPKGMNLTKDITGALQDSKLFQEIYPYGSLDADVIFKVRHDLRQNKISNGFNLFLVFFNIISLGFLPIPSYLNYENTVTVDLQYKEKPCTYHWISINSSLADIDKVTRFKERLAKGKKCILLHLRLGESQGIAVYNGNGKVADISFSGTSEIAKEIEKPVKDPKRILPLLGIVNRASEKRKKYILTYESTSYGGLLRPFAAKANGKNRIVFHYNTVFSYPPKEGSGKFPGLNLYNMEKYKFMHYILARAQKEGIVP